MPKQLKDPFQCSNCRHTDEYDNLPLARDLLDRHECGDTFSDAACPECGALCYEVEPAKVAVTFVAGDCTSVHPRWGPARCDKEFDKIADRLRDYLIEKGNEFLDNELA